MAFEIVAERDSETVTMRRNSSLMAIAKARVWASEGWKVTIVVRDEAPPVSAEEDPPSPSPAPDRHSVAGLAN